MFALHETPAGYAIFKVLDDDIVCKGKDLWSDFQDTDKLGSLVKLVAFHKFDDTTEALAAATSVVEGTANKTLQKFLKKNVGKKEKLAVGESKLGQSIEEALGIEVVSGSKVVELMRALRSQMSNLLEGVDENDMKAMRFSPDKVDTTIVQAISLLDDLDKDLNTYALRVREWYCWHFPEMGKIVPDNILYAKTVRRMRTRFLVNDVSLSDILPEEIEAEVKETAQVSMGTEICDDDVDHVIELCNQVISLHEYRQQLFEYLKNRMNAIAPNLTLIVGELVGARLIAHAGSLMNLAKQPASTIQILGAEKALFRALKKSGKTPKYGIHASLVGQATPKNKGVISRVLSNKTALAIRVDALGEGDATEIGERGREQVEARLRAAEGRPALEEANAVAAAAREPLAHVERWTAT